MELINRKNKDVIEYHKTSTMSLLTIRDTKVMYISHAAVVEFGLIHGRYAHFFRDEDKWFFFASTDPTGFTMHRTHIDRQNCGFHIFSAAVISMVMASTPAKVKDNFVIRKTDKEYEGNKIMEIHFATPLKAYKK